MVRPNSATGELMPTAINAREIQGILNVEQPAVAPELSGLCPRVTTRASINGDDYWISIVCRHPNDRLTDWWEPPKQYLVLHYRIGIRHQWLMGKNGREWAIRRAGLLIRLLLKRLAREVAR